MGKDRLSYLALLHVPYDTDIDIDDKIHQFARLYPRRLELGRICQQARTQRGFEGVRTNPLQMLGNGGIGHGRNEQ